MSKLTAKKPKPFLPFEDRIVERDGRYYYRKSIGAEGRPISDFTIEIKQSYDDPRGWVWIVQITARRGHQTGDLELRPVKMFGVQGFRTWALSQRFAIFSGTAHNLLCLFCYLQKKIPPVSRSLAAPCT